MTFPDERDDRADRERGEEYLAEQAEDKRLLDAPFPDLGPQWDEVRGLMKDTHDRVQEAVRLVGEFEKEDVA